MRNRKLVISMVIPISILLLCALIIAILNLVGIDIVKIVNKRNNSNNQNIAVINLDNNSQTIEQQINEQKLASVENAKLPTGASNVIMNMISSRSDVDRSLYVILEENQENDYEEIKTYIPIEQVTINFNMDVSKTTGLSKEDFISLVQNMKYDKTGILAENAGLIWECCQKYNVNEIFVLGICGIESAWCSASQHQRTHNYASLMSGGKLIQYSSDAAGFEAMIKLLGQKYLSLRGSLYHGSTITGVGKCYCNTTTWPSKVYKCMQRVFE